VIQHSADLLGQRAGPFTIERLIGEGGFASVFAARRDSDNTLVALKILRSQYSGDPEFEARFRSESTIASNLIHPNLVRILEVGQSGALTYFAMDLFPDSVASLIERDGPLDQDRLVTIGAQVAAGLAFAHRRGIVHQDIKGDNILLSSDGAAVIADFGMARAVSSYVTATGVDMTIGTPHYISPEQAQGDTTDGRSDIYALGVTLYKAATGEVPFRSTDWFELARLHVEERPRRPRKKRPELSARLERIILRCLEKRPENRYASADELREELNQIACKVRRTSIFKTSPVTTGQRSIGSPHAVRPWLWRVLAAVLLVALTAALVAILGR